MQAADPTTVGYGVGSPVARLVSVGLEVGFADGFESGFLTMVAVVGRELGTGLVLDGSRSGVGAGAGAGDGVGVGAGVGAGDGVGVGAADGVGDGDDDGVEVEGGYVGARELGDTVGWRGVTLSESVGVRVGALEGDGVYIQ